MNLLGTLRVLDGIFGKLEPLNAAAADFDGRNGRCVRDVLCFMAAYFAGC